MYVQAHCLIRTDVSMWRISFEEFLELRFKCLDFPDTRGILPHLVWVLGFSANCPL